MKGRKWLLALFLMAGAVIGLLVGEMTRSVPALQWLSFGRDIGFSPENPLALELVVLRLKFGLTLHLSVSVIICMGAAGLLYRRFGKK
ncbi:MAG: DUF4321 domain-containing protein [Oscillospiraceae bacterium]|jgi:hypothetical protein|nr:DUF4321 domain-containing protein [Oscillospiraceae bacterium]